MIPDEAVEAAAVILAEAECAAMDRDAGYGDGDNLAPDDYAIFMPVARENARNLLEAAAPHMLAGAWGEGRSAGQMDPYDRYPTTNPYRSKA